MPIRVCQLITTLNPAGAERCVYELATRLDRARFDVQVAALQGGAVADQLRTAGVKVHIVGVGCKCSPLLPRKLRKLIRLLGDERIDLLHTHLYHADLAGRLAARKAGMGRLVHTVHVAEKRWRPWQFAMARWMRRRCDKIVCVSPSVMKWHSARAKLPESGYEVIPNGIDVDAYGPDESARQTHRRQWGAGDDDVVALFVGRLDRQKGIDTLLDAAGRMTGSMRLIIAGDGPMRRQVEAFCRSPQGRRCQWIGFSDDVGGILSAADLFVLPSRTEGWPLALGEAMAAGLPTATTDAPGIHDVVIPDQTGLVVGIENAVGLADSMNALANDKELRQRLGGAGRDLIVERFSIGRMIGAHEQLYDGVVG